MQGRINRYIEDVSKSDGETLGLLASRPNEFSREGPQFGGGHGVFTYYLLKGMMGEADTDGDETVNVTELVDYLDQNVEEATDRQQHVREFGTFEAETPITFIDKPGPEELQLGQLPRPRGTEIASLQVTPPEGAEVRTALQQALREGRLLAPAEDNAWDLYRQFAQLSVPESEKEYLQDDLFIALATAGDRVLSAYRRGDQVIRLDAAKYNEGAQLYGRALELDPEDFTLPPKAKFMAGRALVEGGRYSEGISLLRAAIKLDPEAAHSYNALGIAHMKLGQWNDALANFRAASERAEKWVYPHYNTALVHIARQRYRDAEQEFHKGIELGTELGLKYSYLHYNLGILYLNQGRYKDAEEQFRRAVGMMPDDALSYYNLGLLFEQRGDMRQAEAQFRKAAELDARLVEPRLKLAEIYRKQRRRQLQEAMLRQAVAGAPRNPMALEALGKFLLESEMLEEAEQVFMQMMVNNPAAAAAYSWLGDVHAAQRNFEQAAEDYRQGMARTRDPKLLRELQRKVRSVHLAQFSRPAGVGKQEDASRLPQPTLHDIAQVFHPQRAEVEIFPIRVMRQQIALAGYFLFHHAVGSNEDVDGVAPLDLLGQGAAQPLSDGVEAGFLIRQQKDVLRRKGPAPGAGNDLVKVLGIVVSKLQPFLLGEVFELGNSNDDCVKIRLLLLRQHDEGRSPGQQQKEQNQS